MTQPPITPAELRRGFPIRLPSGLEVHMRPIDRTLMLKLGNLPSEIMAIVAKGISLSQEEYAEAREEYRRRDPIELARNDRKMMEEFARVAVVSPRIVATDPKDDELSLDDLLSEDLEFMWGQVNKPAHELRRFSERQAQLVAALQNAPDPQPAAEQTPESETNSSKGVGGVGEIRPLDA